MKEILAGRIGLGDIRRICSIASDDDSRETLFTLIFDTDPRISYNALWVLTHFEAGDRQWLISRRNDLINHLLTTDHIGKQRLILTLLEGMPTAKDDLRTDYLDYCLSRINSTLPYGIGALCLKQAFAQCRHYPELIQELRAEIELMDRNELSPGVASARRKVLSQINKLKIRYS